MTEEYKSILTLVVSDFKKAAKEASDAVKGVKKEMDETKKVTPFAKATEGAKKAADAVKRAATAIKDAGKAAYSTNGGFSALRNGINSTSMAAKSLTAVLGKFLSVAAIVAGIKAAISAGASALADEAQFAQVFGAYEGQARETLKGIADQAGSTADAMRSSFSTIASFARVSGMDTGDALNLASRAMTAAADSAAYYDRNLSDVTENLRSYLKGNYENDAALGLSSTEYTRNAMAMQLYGQKFNELSEQQKQWTLLAQVEQANQLSGAMGQAAREAGNWATQIQKLKAQFKSIISVIGRGFIAILTPVVTALNTVMGALVEFANAVSEVFSLVFGSAQAALTATAGSVDTGGLSDALNGVEDSAAGAADGVDGVGKAAKGAASAAKELARQVMGFDKITKLAATATGSSDGGSGYGSGTGGAGSGTGAGVSGGLSEAAGASVLSSVKDQLTDFQQAFKDWLGSIKALAQAGDWKGVGGALADGFGTAVDFLREKVNSPEVRQILFDAVDKVTGILNGFFEGLTFSDGVKESIATRFGQLIGDSVVLAISTADKFLVDVNWEAIGKTFAQNLNGAVSSLSTAEVNFGRVFADYLNAGISGIGGFASEVRWSEIGQFVADNVNSFFKTVSWSDAGKAAHDLIGGLADMLTTAIEHISTQDIGNALEEFLEGLDPIDLVIKIGRLALSPLNIDGAIQSIKDFGAQMAKEIPAALEESLSGTGKFLADLVQAPLTGLKNVGSVLLEIFSPESLTEAVESGVNLANGILRGIGQVFDALPDWIKTHIFALFISAFKIAFGIHSPASNPELLEAAGNVGKGILNGIGAVFTNIGKWVGDNILTPIKSAMGGAGAKLDVAISLVKSGWTSLKDFIGDKVNAVVTFAKKSGQKLKDLIGDSTSAVVTFAKKKGQKLGDLIGDKLKVSIGIVKGWKGTVAKALGLNKLASKFSIKLPKVSVTWSGRPIPLPHFHVKWNAKGGILDGAQIFGMAGNTLLGGGERGREAVLPLESNTGWMDTLADKVAARVGGQGGSNQPIRVQVVLDGKVVAESTVRQLRNQARGGNYPLAGLV